MGIYSVGMRDKKILIMIGGIGLIFILGIIFIVLSAFNSTDTSTNGIKDSFSIRTNSTSHGEGVDIKSSFDSEIVDAEIDFENVEVEIESLDATQVYFENILSLYDYFTLIDVEYFKQNASKFIHDNIDPSILDCTLIVSTINKNENVVSFELSADNKIVSVEMVKDANGYLNTKFKRLIADGN